MNTEVNIDKEELVETFPVKVTETYDVYANKDMTDKFLKNISELIYHAYNRDVHEIQLEIDRLSDFVRYRWISKIQNQMEREGEITDNEDLVRDFKRNKEIENKYGIENLQFENFEWHQIEGKLSALHWVFGNDWDDFMV